MNAWFPTRDASVPIKVSHKGNGTEYFIEVDGRQASDKFILNDGNVVELDVPVTLKDIDGKQEISVCSIADHGTMKSRICTHADLYLIK